jgi:exonuclease VII large subunit
MSAAGCVRDLLKRQQQQVKQQQQQVKQQQQQQQVKQQQQKQQKQQQVKQEVKTTVQRLMQGQPAQRLHSHRCCSSSSSTAVRGRQLAGLGALLLQRHLSKVLTLHWHRLQRARPHRIRSACKCFAS